MNSANDCMRLQWCIYQCASSADADGAFGLKCVLQRICLNFPNLESLVSGYIDHILPHPVGRELAVDVGSIVANLLYISRLGIGQCLYACSVTHLEIFEFHHPAVVVEIGTGNAGQHQVGTTGRKILLQCKCIIIAQVAASKFKE